MDLRGTKIQGYGSKVGRKGAFFVVLRVHLDVHKLTLITSLTDFGNYQDPMVIKKAKGERHKFGSFYYRFPHGESASDVVSIFF